MAKVLRTSDWDAVTCNSCGAKWDGRRKSCKRCGGMGRRFVDTCVGYAAAHASVEERYTYVRRNIPAFTGNALVTFGSPILGLVLARVPGFAVGLILAVVGWYLSPLSTRKVVEIGHS